MTPRERAYATAMLWFPDKEPDNMQVVALAAHIELALTEHEKVSRSDITPTSDHCEKHPEPYTCCGVAQSYEKMLDAEREQLADVTKERDALRRDLDQELSAHRQTIAERDAARRSIEFLESVAASRERRADAAERDARVWERTALSHAARADAAERRVQLVRDLVASWIAECDSDLESCGLSGPACMTCAGSRAIKGQLNQLLEHLDAAKHRKEDIATKRR